MWWQPRSSILWWRSRAELMLTPTPTRRQSRQIGGERSSSTSRVRYAHACLPPRVRPFLSLRPALCSAFRSGKIRAPFSSRLETEQSRRAAEQIEQIVYQAAAMLGLVDGRLKELGIADLTFRNAPFSSSL